MMSTIVTSTFLQNKFVMAMSRPSPHFSGSVKGLVMPEYDNVKL